MVAVLALVFFAAAVSGPVWTPGSAAQTFFYLIVVLWGARNAGLSVVGEIREHTWDSQRLSSISPAKMVWGKLFGSTVYNWFGGAICLAVMLAYGFAHSAPAQVLLDVIYYVTAGVIAQSSALLASLIAVRRRSSHSRLDVFIYQIVGIIAALGVLYVWKAADPEGALTLGRKPADFIAWWGTMLDARPFLIISLAIFAAWILTGCYRQMRLELQLRNGPWVWLGFLAFMGLYVAGFDAWLTKDQMVQWSTVALRLALASSAYAVITYAMVLLEPKDRVLYRWYGSQLASGNIGRALWNVQAWIMSWFATAVVAAALVWWLSAQGADPKFVRFTISGLGFLTRDAAIFVFFAATRRRGDFAALVALFVLYVLAPAILDGLGLKTALPFFYPQLEGTSLVGPSAAWCEALIAIGLTATRLALGEKSAAEA